MAKELSRRDFLKGMAAGAMGIAAAGVLGTVEAPKAHADALYTPGTYTASAKGIASDVKVTMEFSESEILSVKIDASGETPELGGKAAPVLEQAILDAQGVDVDAVSGATVTTDAVKKAVANCISQASGKAVVVQEAAETFNADWLGTKPEISDADIKSARIWRALVDEDALLYAASQAHGTENPIRYIDKIIKSWSLRGVTTLEKAKLETAPPKPAVVMPT